jgi:hypothetical protein
VIFRRYNDAGGRKFGGISLLKMAKDLRIKPTAPFTDEPADYSYPDGLIMPLVYGLKALMEIDEKGHVPWKVNRIKLLEDCLPAVVKKYRVILDAFRFDHRNSRNTKALTSSCSTRSRLSS